MVITFRKGFRVKYFLFCFCGEERNLLLTLVCGYFLKRFSRLQTERNKIKLIFIGIVLPLYVAETVIKEPKSDRR